MTQLDSIQVPHSAADQGLTDEEHQRRASVTVMRHAQNPEDAKFLLAMLGLPGAHASGRKSGSSRRKPPEERPKCACGYNARPGHTTCGRCADKVPVLAVAELVHSIRAATDPPMTYDQIAKAAGISALTLNGMMAISRRTGRTSSHMHDAILAVARKVGADVG